MTVLRSIPADRLRAALAHPSNQGAARIALQAALDAKGHRRASKRESEAQRVTGSAGEGKRRGVPTKLEAKFAREILEPMVASGEIVGYECEGLTLRHGGTAVTPDFVGWEPSGRPMLFEVKGTRLHEATVLRMKLHAAARPWLRWRIYARRDGAWRLHFDSLP